MIKIFKCWNESSFFSSSILTIKNSRAKIPITPKGEKGHFMFKNKWISDNTSL